MAIGFRVYMKRNLPEQELVEKFRGMPTANVCDCMERLGIMNDSIKLYSRPVQKSMVGVALTVKTRNGDNLMIHQAIDMAGKGDVIVVDNEGGRNRSLAGAIMFGYMKFKEIEGIVFDGPIRDYDTVCEMDWPIYATGITSRGPYKEGPGEINVPISCGNVAVHPGDIILGDMDGVLVIPRLDAEEVLRKAIPFMEKDAEKSENAPKGIVNREWVRTTLEKKNAEMINDVYPG